MNTMNDHLRIKDILFKKCQTHAATRIQTIEQTLHAIEESRNNETKSSVGDKYETGRAMMQMEEEKMKHQLFQAIQENKELLKIDPQKQSPTVEVGSLVITNKGKYYLSIGLGKVMVEKERYYCVSIQSPIGQQLFQQEVGKAFEFNGSKMVIQDIY